MERTEIKPLDPTEDNLVGTNLNEDTWVPFNDTEPLTETRVPPRPEPSEFQQQQQQQQQAPMEQQQYVQYMDVMPTPPTTEPNIMNSIQQTPIATLGVVFGVGLLLGFMFSNRRPIILGNSL